MEFGVFAQLFVPQFERDQDPNAEHKRIFRNVEIAKAADRNAFKYVWCPQHHFLDEYSHMPGPEAFLGYCAGQTERVHLGSAIFNITPAGQQAPAHRRERGAARPPDRATASSSAPAGAVSSTEVLGFDIESVDITKAMWRETIREIPKMWKDAPYSYDGEFFRMPERKVFPKPHGPLHPAMWVAGGSPGTFTEAGELGLGVFCFSIGRPTDMEPLLQAYKAAIVDATPVGDYVNDNIMGVTNMLCMEDRRKAFETAANMGMNYYSTLAYHWLDNVPRPKHLPEWPEPRSPSPRPSRSSSSRPRATSPWATPTTAPARCSAGSTWASTSSPSAPPPTPCPPRSWSGRWSCSAARSSPSSTPIPSTRPPGTVARQPHCWVAAERGDTAWASTRRHVQHGRHVGDGGRRRPRARGPGGRRPAPHLRRARGPRQPARPPPGRARASAPATTSPSTSRTAPSTSRPCWPPGSCGPSPINVNHRYVADELRYLLDNSDAVAVLTQPSLAPVVDAVAGEVPAVRFTLVTGDDYDGALAAAPAGAARRRRPQRRRPLHHLHRRHDRPAQGRGVAPRRRLLLLHRRRRPACACRGAGRPARRAARPHPRAAAVLPPAGADDARRGPVDLVLVALRGQQGRADAGLARPRRRVADRRRRGRQHDDRGGRRGGPAPARRLGPGGPRARPTTARRCSRCPTAGRPWRPPPASASSPPCPTSWSPTASGRRRPGTQGAMRVAAGSGRPAPSLVRFDQPHQAHHRGGRPDGAEVGARFGRGRGRCWPGGRLPLGYYNDPDKTAATFVERDGERWLVTGDMATVGADGAIELLGRGSVSRSTPAARRCSPRRSRATLKAPPRGVRLPRGGRARRALGQRGHRGGAAGRRAPRPRSASWPPTARRTLAGYKAPKHLVLVDAVVRSPSGKADYRWARDVAGEAPVSPRSSRRATRRCAGPGTGPRRPAAARPAPRRARRGRRRASGRAPGPASGWSCSWRQPVGHDDALVGQRAMAPGPWPCSMPRRRRRRALCAGAHVRQRHRPGPGQPKIGRVTTGAGRHVDVEAGRQVDPARRRPRRWRPCGRPPRRGAARRTR